MQFSPPFQFKWPILCRKHICTLINSRFKSAANSPSTCCYSSSSSSTAEHQDKSKEVDIESLGKCQLQFNSGAGGTEAAHFTRDLYEMYQRFAEWNQWQWCPFNMDFHQTGIRSAHVSVQGDLCYAKLRFEGGVHRVQRRPLTDKSRIHTSTVSIAVLPEPEKPEVMFNPGDIHIESMRSSGAGGANVNAKSTAIRILHKPTGIALKVQDERSVHANERLAYQRLSAILLKRQVDEMNRKYSGNRKLQVGTLERSEKIRTFNYKDDLVTDHRLKHSFNSIEKFLAGGEQLELMVNMLVDMYELEGLEAEEEEEKRRRNKDTEESKISSAKAK